VNRIFATLRRRLLSENRFTHYLGYAAGNIDMGGRIHGIMFRCARRPTHPASP